MLGQQVPLATLASDTWDVVVIGGGITGAGIFLESARRGLKVLLLEQQDFSWGTSSRSSKMVHGGLRYIAQGDISLTHHSLQERERLLTELPQLVVRMSYYFPIRKGQFPGRLPMQLVMKAYDALARVNDHNWLNPTALQQQFPHLNSQQLKGALRYTDALTDDSRLVIRVLQEGCLEGGIARNYSKVSRIHQQDGQQVFSVLDRQSQQSIEVRCKHLFNATGLWADQLSGASPRIRPQRGSHLFISKARLPIQSCLTLLHPDDQRYVFVYPWKGETCVGTTDLDHRFALDDEAFCTTQEVDYLLKLLNSEFPDLHIGKPDILSTMAGVRPIIAGHASNPSAFNPSVSNPSKERRSHLVWQANGVISVSGGKLTTFRQIALDALHTAGIIDDSSYKIALKNKAIRCFNHQVSTPS
ncbi:MAG: glycerol-3-phosphate dehydrogenase/oxidase, partial [Sphingobacteriales bacterium]